MGQRHFGNLAGEVCPLRRPIAKCRPETVNGYPRSQARQRRLQWFVRYPAPSTGEYELTLAGQSLKHLHCRIAEGNAVLAPTLHSLRRDDPHIPLDFIPARADYLARPSRSQNQELKRGRTHGVLPTKLGHERADVGIGQGGHMLDLPHLAARGKEVFKMPLPSGRVLALAQTASLGPIQDGLDASAHTRGRLWDRAPYRLKRLHD